MNRSGIVGLGQMGVPKACSLMHRIGYRHWDSSELPAADRTVVDSVAGVAPRADVLQRIGPDACAVQQVRCGKASTLYASPGAMFACGDLARIDTVRPMRNAVSGL